jgi:hypothetical protein
VSDAGTMHAEVLALRQRLAIEPDPRARQVIRLRLEAMRLGLRLQRAIDVWPESRRELPFLMGGGRSRPK